MIKNPFDPAVIAAENALRDAIIDAHLRAGKPKPTTMLFMVGTYEGVTRTTFGCACKVCMERMAFAAEDLTETAKQPQTAPERMH